MNATLRQYRYLATRALGIIEQNIRCYPSRWRECNWRLSHKEHQVELRASLEPEGTYWRTVTIEIGDRIMDDLGWRIMYRVMRLVDRWRKREERREDEARVRDNVRHLNMVLGNESGSSSQALLKRMEQENKRYEEFKAQPPGSH